MNRDRALAQLSACLRGGPPPECDWRAVLALANQSLLTPQLAAALETAAAEVPAAERAFLAEVRRRNRERNRRLGVLLEDAVIALNAAGIEPTLLKGAALLVAGAADDRLLSDIDLLVAPGEVAAAEAALAGAGFAVLRRRKGAAVHVAVELGRPQDPGALDLHQRPPGPPGLAESPDLAARRRPIAVGRGRALAPDAASQILHIVLHDQFHDGDYWRGGFDLRHLTDLARLAPALDAEDRLWLRRACGTPLVRRALAASLLAAERFAGGAPASGEEAERTYRRWRLQHAWPVLRAPLAALALAAEWRDVAAHRAANRLGRRRVLGEEAAAEAFSPLARLERLFRILQVRPGKI